MNQLNEEIRAIQNSIAILRKDLTLKDYSKEELMDRTRRIVELQGELEDRLKEAGDCNI